MVLTEFLLARIAEDEANLLRLVDPLEFVDDTYEQRWGERVLAECDAKRRIVGRLMVHGREGKGDFRDGYTAALKDALGDLALPYADHPDYRDEWRA